MSNGAALHPAYGVLRPVTPLASVLLAENPSPMTLDGTNTWVLRVPGAEHCVVVDPGEADPVHLRRVAAHGPVALVLLTHHHHDHAGGAQRFADLVGAPVRALDPALVVGAEPLVDGEVLTVAGLRIRVLATPGHTADSTCFALDRSEGSGRAGGTDPAVLTGDTILGRGTTVIAHPDGALGPYLASLALLAGLPVGRPALPGHGPELPDVAEAARRYLAHRAQRLDQVRAALTRLGPGATAREVVADVYGDVDATLWDAAELSVRAQLDHLRGG